jgi:hypothetical protein
MATEILSHLNAEAFDLAKMAAFIAAILINRQAVLIVVTQLLAELLFAEMKSEPVVYYCASSALFAIAATINIKLSFNIRQALICVACLNWLAAMDFKLSDGVTAFYLCYPWLINGLDVFILFCLLRRGGRSIVGISHPFIRRVVAL